MTIEKKEYKTDFNNRPLVAEFSNLTEQANGSVTIKYGETIVIATAVMSEYQREGLGYFPLTVDYEEKFYAAGKILGGRFMRREGRPSEEAVLNGRMIDRTLRPLFDKRIRNDIQIIVIALSIDEDNNPDVPAVLAASLALAASDIPWDGPIGAVRIGKIKDKFVVNPTYKEKEESDIDLVICGKDDKINMIEGEARQVSEENILKAFETSLPEIKKLIEFQNNIIKEIGKEKIWPEIKEKPDGLESFFKKHTEKALEKALGEPTDKKSQYFILGDLKNAWLEAAEEKFGAEHKSQASDFFEEQIDKIIHKNVLEHEKRPDGRKLDEVRNISTQVGILPRAHGSGLFYRGLTHIFSIATLGAPADFLIIEGMEVREKRNFMHHYNFPPFSVGETGRMGGPGRREIGHGTLARKALKQIIPERDEFPYTIRLVSETMSSNGSSSMGAVCASTLALMDAGVPIKTPVSGVAMGLMMENKNKYKVLTDIQGPEDHHGDADFKTAGTEKGVTAIQMDVKVGGLTTEILGDILKQSKKARLEILEKMLETIPQSRKEISKHAPHIITMNINPEKKGGVIGPGGKTIHKIIADTETEIDLQEDGTVFITGKNVESTQKAKAIIEELTYEPKIGETFKGRVVKTVDFGAFVEIKTGIEGLVHISELAPFRVEKVNDIVKEGDIVPVKIKNIDNMGKISLSVKQADPNYAKNDAGRKQQRKQEK